MFLFVCSEKFLWEEWLYFYGILFPQESKRQSSGRRMLLCGIDIFRDEVIISCDDEAYSPELANLLYAWEEFL